MVSAVDKTRDVPKNEKDDKNISAVSLAAGSTFGSEPRPQQHTEEGNSTRQQKGATERREKFQALHREMEIAEYNKTSHGHIRRKTARHLSKSRTNKRKALEADDAEMHAMTVVEDFDLVDTRSGTAVFGRGRKRLRGSKVAFEDSVVNGSSIFAAGDSQHQHGVNNSGSIRISNRNENLDQDMQHVKYEDNNDFEHDAGEDDGEIADICGVEKWQGHGRYETYAEELNLKEDDLEDKIDDDDESVNGSNDESNGADMASSNHEQKLAKANKHFVKKGKKGHGFIARRMYRLKNFKSHRMAQRHGDALGAHARGMPKTAVQKLDDVASAAPVAPQVYSSLGLVYESMLQQESLAANTSRSDNECSGNSFAIQQQNPNEAETNHICGDVVDTAFPANSEQGTKNMPGLEAVDEEDDDEEDENSRSIKHRVDLATKAYGSFHIAAILCKKDFTLWVRAADAAMKISDLHTHAMTLLPFTSATMSEGVLAASTTVASLTKIDEKRVYHWKEKIRWMEEAKDDYIIADNLHPPGVTVPAKLAFVHMELGNLSEALTILTDLKNGQTAQLATSSPCGKQSISTTKSKRAQRRLERSELDQSYNVWLLYANLMLRIGHECIQWNRGIYTNENYMFRRWLRKYSSTFDWQERRLQALCLALEAAAGTKSCSKLTEWKKSRLKIMGRGEKSNISGTLCSQQWQIDAYEADRMAQQERADKAIENNKEKRENGESGKQEEKKIENEDMSGNGDDLHPNSKIHFAAPMNGIASQCSGSALSSTGEGKDGRSDNTEAEEEKGSEIVDDCSAASVTANVSSSFFLFSLSERNSTSDSSPFKTVFAQERELLLLRNKTELANFDKTTLEMNLVPTSSAAVNRAEARHALVKKHKKSIVVLVGDYHEKQAAIAAEAGIAEISVTDEGSSLPPLPLSASCATVCNIASQLMKQCLGLELYRAGRLVAESVVAYFRERAARHKERLEIVYLFQHRQTMLKENIVQLEKEKYDEINHHSTNESDGDDVSITILSDDDDFDKEDNTRLVKSIGEGTLPTELQALYSLSLIGEGGKDFVAAKMLPAMNELVEVETIQNENALIDISVSKDASWILFRRAMTEPMCKTTAFAFAADLLQKMNKETEWSDALADIFQAHLENLDGRGELQKVLSHSPGTSATASAHRAQLLKIMLSTARMKLVNAKKVFLGATDADTDDVQIEVSLAIALSIVGMIVHFQEAFWSSSTLDSIKPTGVEAVKVLSGSISLACQCVHQSKYNIRKEQKRQLVILSKLRSIVSMICRMDIPSHDDVRSSAFGMMSASWRSFPVTCEWQDDYHREITKRAYNLCIGCTVSAFSGWEKEEFTLDLLKQKRGPNYFGVNVYGMQVAGYLSTEAELELASQWVVIGKLIPTLEKLNFIGLLKKAKTAEWYVAAMEKLSLTFQNRKVSVDGEENGIMLLLYFSRLCLQVAEHEQDDVIEEELIKNSLSVVLPLSQFCLDKTLWTSTMGTIATTQGGALEWENFLDTRSKFEGSTETFIPPPLPPCRQRPASGLKSNNTRLGENFKRIRETRSPLDRLIKIPVATLLQEWKGKDIVNEDVEEDSHVNKWTQHSSGSAKLAMNRVDFLLRKLRQCSTISALQKASVEIAAALVNLSSHKECRNPFLCMNQAAVFASQGSKGGNSDEAFKKPLPNERDCTADEALNFLARADCMRAVHFTDESIFLCSYVVELCRLHRDRENTDFSWTAKWRVVSIYAYMLSVSIDATILSLMEGEARAIALSMWEIQVKEEIARGRSDALVLSRATTKLQLARKSAVSSLKSLSEPPTIGFAEKQSQLFAIQEPEESWNHDDVLEENDEAEDFVGEDENVDENTSVDVDIEENKDFDIHKDDSDEFEDSQIVAEEVGFLDNDITGRKDANQNIINDKLGNGWDANISQSVENVNDFMLPIGSTLISDIPPIMASNEVRFHRCYERVENYDEVPSVAV